MDVAEGLELFSHNVTLLVTLTNTDLFNEIIQGHGPSALALIGTEQLIEADTVAGAELQHFRQEIRRVVPSGKLQLADEWLEFLRNLELDNPLVIDILGGIKPAGDKLTAFCFNTEHVLLQLTDSLPHVSVVIITLYANHFSQGRDRHRIVSPAVSYLNHGIKCQENTLLADSKRVSGPDQVVVFSDNLEVFAPPFRSLFRLGHFLRLYHCGAGHWPPPVQFRSVPQQL
ncbi:MAG: hypothetical protein A4E60_02738 [Syntrophorhabdus sp. PtaB.Bin047]|nr:MAG: hypothetical protein A4E60_02738 [Syntrophorhabdus sp. PtaB.Bin047]